jgi:hypothetical protein
MSGLAQITGVVLVAVAGWLIWGSPWWLAGGGAVLLIAPEIADLVRGRPRDPGPNHPARAGLPAAQRGSPR